MCHDLKSCLRIVDCSVSVVISTVVHDPFDQVLINVSNSLINGSNFVSYHQVLINGFNFVSYHQVFVTVITDVSAKDVQCQDELALAYISNSSIFPVSLKKYRDISPSLDGGMYVISYSQIVGRQRQYALSLCSLIIL